MVLGILFIEFFASKSQNVAVQPKNKKINELIKSFLFVILEQEAKFLEISSCRNHF